MAYSKNDTPWPYGDNYDGPIEQIYGSIFVGWLLVGAILSVFTIAAIVLWFVFL